jgi:hypothetical protein
MKKLLVVGLLLSSSAFANDTDDPKVVYKKETEIDFEALELEGELVKPQGALVLERKRANFNPLIKLRKDFTSEISQSAKDVQ